MYKNHLSALHLIVFISLLIGSQTIYAQPISGVLKDGETDQALPFVNISTSSTYGVITNSEGEFTIQTNYLSEKDTLYFSSLGYDSKRISLQDIDEKPIYLHPTSFTLTEVFLTNKELSAEEILKRFIENASENYISDFQKFSIFKREKENIRNDKMEVDFKKANFLSRAERKAFNENLNNQIQKSGNENQTFQDTYFHLYQNDQSEFKLDPVLATRLGDPDKEKSIDKVLVDAGETIKNKLKSNHTFKVKSGLLKLQDSLNIQANKSTDSLKMDRNKSELGRLIEKYDFGKSIDLDFIKNPKDFDYQLIGVTNLGEEFVYQISFEPRKSKFLYRGELFISAETFALIKLNYAIVEPQRTPGILKTVLGVHHELIDSMESAVFQKDTSQKYHLKYVHRIENQQTYLNRNIKFIENSPDSDRMTLKAKLLVDQNLQSDSQYMMVNIEKIQPDTFKNLEDKVDIPLRIIRKYDPAIWEDYNIISPDKSMREFK